MPLVQGMFLVVFYTSEVQRGGAQTLLPRVGSLFHLKSLPAHFFTPSLFSPMVAFPPLLLWGLHFPFFAALKTRGFPNSHLFILNVCQESRKQVIDSINRGSRTHRLTLKLNSLSETVTFKSDPVFTEHVFHVKHHSQHSAERFHLLLTSRLQTNFPLSQQRKLSHRWL